MLVWWRYNTHTHTQPSYGFLDFVQDNVLGEPVPEDTFSIFWIFWSKMNITQADAPTIWMDCHPIQTNWCRHLCHPHHFYAGCPSLHNPPNLSWLGTGTKYAGLHAQWFGWWRYKGRSESEGAVWKVRIKLCVMHGIVRHSACATELQPALPVWGPPRGRLNLHVGLLQSSSCSCSAFPLLSAISCQEVGV